MKKLLAIFSSVICLFAASNAYSNQCVNPYAGQYYDRPCVGQCGDSCASRCSTPCRTGRFYVGGFGGANWSHFHRVENIRPKMDVGYAGAVSLGYKFQNGFRTEGEVSYRNNHLHKVEHASDYSGDYSTASGHLKGSTHSWSYMGNVLYDFDHVSCYLPNVVPYLGVGVGYTQIHAHVKDHGKQESFRGHNNGFAYQGIAGVGYRLTNDTTLGVEYRCFAGRQHAEDHSVGLALRQSF